MTGPEKEGRESAAPERCPEPGCENGKVWAGHEGDQTFVGDCPRCAPSPAVDRDVLDEVVRDALRGVSSGVGHNTRIKDAILAHIRREVEQALREQAPVIVQAERTRIREGIERLRTNAVCDRDTAPSHAAYQRHHGRIIGLDAVLALLDEEARNG